MPNKTTCVIAKLNDPSLLKKIEYYERYGTCHPGEIIAEKAKLEKIRKEFEEILDDYF